MARASYWIAFYRSISNPDALAAYAKLAGPAIAAAGGRFFARGKAAEAYEAGGPPRGGGDELYSAGQAGAAHHFRASLGALKRFVKAAARGLCSPRWQW